jgi:hypothetical protein
MGNSCQANFDYKDDFQKENLIPISTTFNETIDKNKLKGHIKNKFSNSEINYDYDSVIKFLNNNKIINLSNENPNIENNKVIKKFDSEFKYSKFVIFEEKGERICLIKELNFTENTQKYFEQLYQIIKLKLPFLLKCQGYIPLDNKILLIYPYISNNLLNFIEKDVLDFTNKLIITENLLLSLKICHENNLKFTYVNIGTIYFVGNSMKMKILGLVQFEDENMEKQKKIDIIIIGNMLLQIFSGIIDNVNINNLELIDNLYIKAFIIGLIREDINEIPNENDIIEKFYQIKNNLNNTNEIYT